MNAKLNSEDQLAVDFVLDQAKRLGTPAGASQPATSQSSLTHPPADPKRIEAVERLLKRLDHLPAPEPAADLLERTLMRIRTGHGPTAAVLPSEDRRNTPIQ
jgi:hypothetical protein